MTIQGKVIPLWKAVQFHFRIDVLIFVMFFSKRGTI